MSNLFVEIILHDELTDSAVAWFDGLLLEKAANGSTRLSGEIADQPALHGLLERIRDLNLRLVSVRVQSLPSKENR